MLKAVYVETKMSVQEEEMIICQSYTKIKIANSKVRLIFCLLTFHQQPVVYAQN